MFKALCRVCDKTTYHNNTGKTVAGKEPTGRCVECGHPKRAGYKGTTKIGGRIVHHPQGG